MSNIEIAYQHFINEGFTPAQSAGIVGNLQQESGVNPESVQQGGPGRGIAQWSSGGRWIPSLMTGNTRMDLEAQLNYIDQELQSNPGYGLATLRQAPDVTTAAQIFGTDYERYGIAGNRIQDATQVLQDAQKGSWPNAGDITASDMSAGSQSAELTSTKGGESFWDKIKNRIFGIDTPNGSLSLTDIGTISQELGTVVGFGAKQEPQNVKSNGFLSSLDEMLNPSVSLFNPFGIVTMALARGGFALFGLFLLVGGIAVIIMHTQTGREAVVGAVKGAALA